MTIHAKLFAAATFAVGLVAIPGVAAASPSIETIVVLGGAIKDPANAQYAKAPEDKSVPEIPVVYESKPAAGKVQTAPVNSRAPA